VSIGIRSRHQNTDATADLQLSCPSALPAKISFMRPSAQRRCNQQHTCDARDTRPSGDDSRDCDAITTAAARAIEV